MRFAFALVASLLAGGAAAQAPDDPGARQISGLFHATCVRYAGQPAAMRAALSQRGVPRLSPQARQAFLQGRPGEAFDASNQVTRLALVSEDNGVCSAFAARADGRAAVALFEAFLRDGRVMFTARGDRDNAQNPAIHVWHYEIVQSGQRYSVVISYNGQPTQVQTIMTVAPARQ